MDKHDIEIIEKIREHIVKSLNPVALKVFDEAIEELCRSRRMSKGLEQCDKCDYFISVEEAYQQGCIDGIDKLVEKLNNIFEYRHDMNEVRRIAEEFKEKNK